MRMMRKVDMIMPATIPVKKTPVVSGTSIPLFTIRGEGTGFKSLVQLSDVNTFSGVGHC